MNAIITAATGYTKSDLEPFLRSIDRACRESKVFLIAYKRDYLQLHKLCREYPFIEPVYVHRTFNSGGGIYRWIPRHLIDEDYLTCSWFWQGLGRYSLHIMLERFFLALEIVQVHRRSFTNVLLTDSRDVVFQRNPFVRIDRSLISGLEEKTIGDCPINSDWIKHIYGANVHASLRDRRIVCAGITLGPVSEVEKYLVAMCREIWRCLPKVASSEGYDQGIHNYLIYSGQISLELTENSTGIIATLQYENPGNILIDAVAGVITVQGQAPAIIHQYDRHHSLLSYLGGKGTVLTD